MKKTNNKRYLPATPWAPEEPKREHFNTHGATSRKVIYHDVELIGDYDIDLEECFAEQGEKLPHPTLNFNQISLQDIVDLAPPGAKLSDIKLHISYPRMVEYLEVKFIHMSRDLAAEEKAFLRAQKQYQKDLDQYLIEKKSTIRKWKSIGFGKKNRKSNDWKRN